MKLVKWIPTLAAVLVLAACSNTGDVAAKGADAAAKTEAAATNAASEAKEAGQAAENTAKKPLTGNKSFTYTCLNKVKVSANYSFEEGKPKKVDLKVGKKVIKGLAYDMGSPERVSFKSDKYVWDLSQAGGMLTERGKGSDNILAKECGVDDQKK